MNVKWNTLLVLTVAFGLASAGCGMQAGGGALDEANLASLPDVDGDGLPELEVPDTVDSSQMLGIVFTNEITTDQAAGLAPAGTPTDLIGLINIRVEFEVTLQYVGGESVSFDGSRPLGPFTIPFEAACPDNVIVSVSVIAAIPFLGDQTVFEEEFNASTIGGAGALELACDSIFRIVARIDDQGNPSVDLTVEPQQ